MADGDGRAGANRWAHVTEMMSERYRQMVQVGVAELMVDGFPPFSDKLTPYQQYQKLTAMRGKGDAAFWNNPQAQALLAKLENQFGQAPPIAGPGYAPAGVPALTGRVLGTTQVSQKLGEPQLGGIV